MAVSLVLYKCYGGAIYRCGIEIKLYDEKVVFKKKEENKRTGNQWYLNYVNFMTP